MRLVLYSLYTPGLTLLGSLISAQMAYMSNRAYAFQPYLWDIHAWYRTVMDGDTERSAVIPLNTFLNGPAAGGPMPTPANPNEPPAPRAVSWHWFDEVRI